MKLENFLLTFILLFQGAILALLIIGGRDIREVSQRMDRLERLATGTSQKVAEPEPSSRSFQPPAIFVSLAAPTAQPPVTAPAPTALSSAWIMPHPPANTGRFLHFESYREQKGLEGRAILVFKEWDGKQFIDTAVPVSEVRWDVKPQ